MATVNKFPPDVPRNWDETQEAGESAKDGLRAKMASAADKVTGSVRDGYERSMEAVSDMDPMETMRESGDAVIRAVERHPIAAFGLGALSVGLIAWASLRDNRRWYEPDVPAWRRLFSDYGDEAMKSGDGLLRSGRKWFNASASDAHDYADQARGYARDGGRYLMQRSEREPLAALVGIGLAVYVIGSLLAPKSETKSLPARRRSGGRQ